jgi:hypothetical protein
VGWVSGSGMASCADADAGPGVAPAAGAVAGPGADVVAGPGTDVGADVASRSASSGLAGGSGTASAAIPEPSPRWEPTWGR